LKKKINTKKKKNEFYLKKKIGATIRFPEGLENTPFKLKVLKYQWNFRPQATVISKFGETPNVHVKAKSGLFLTLISINLLMRPHYNMQKLKFCACFAHENMGKTPSKEWLDSWKRIAFSMFPILGTNLWLLPWWRALVRLCWWEDKWGLDVRVHCAWWQTTHAFCAPQDGGRPHLLGHVVLKVQIFWEGHKMLKQSSIFLRYLVVSK
jgi:hypothetical protein